TDVSPLEKLFSSVFGSAQMIGFILMMSAMMHVPDYVHRSSHYLVGLQARLDQQYLREKIKLLSHYEQLTDPSGKKVAFSIGSVAKITRLNSFQVSETK